LITTEARRGGNKVYDNRAKAASQISYTDQWLDDKAFFDYGEVDIETEVELILYDKVEGGKDGDEGNNTEFMAPIGILWLRVSDIIDYNYASTFSNDTRSDDSTRINTWFTIAPVGQMNMTIDFSKTSQLLNDMAHCSKLVY
jgi:hypothetical protein